MSARQIPYSGTSQFLAPMVATVTAAAGGMGQVAVANSNTVAFTIVNQDPANGVEYSFGEIDWHYLGKGGGAVIQGNLAAGLRLRLVNDGATSVIVELTGESLPANNFPTVKPGPKKIVAVGDSLVDYGDRFGRLYNDPTVLNFAIIKGATLATPAGSGTLTWSREASTLQWTAPGDSIGAPVKVTSGIYVLPSGTAGYELTVGCKAFTMAATASGSETIAPATTTLSWNKSNGGFMHIMDALTGHRFQILRNYGISGISAFEIVGNMMQQAINSGADIIVDNAGTNDLQLRNRTAAQVIADRVACWDQAGAAGKQVIGLLLSPRWGRDATGGTTGLFQDSTKYSATLQARLVAVNRGLIAAAASRSWVRIADYCDKVMDGSQTDNRVRNGYTKDGLHDAGGLAYERARVLARILNVMYPNDAARVNIGAGSYYNATENPGGNLLRTNQGGFAGTTGTAGTGVTIGTGLATGLSSGRAAGSANIVATMNKVAATDGGQDWQELVISGATVNYEGVGIYFQNIDFTQVAIGDTLEFSYEFQVVGAGCAGTYSDMFMTMTAPGYQPSAQSLQQIIQGMRDGETGVVATEPYTIQPGTTTLGPRIYVQSLAGATFSIRYRNADLRKVLA